MSEELQYDDEGFPGHWKYVPSKNSHIFIREGETLQQSVERIRVRKEEQTKLYQMRRNAEKATEQEHEFTAREKRFRETAQNLYKEVNSLKFTIPKALNFNNPESIENFAKSLVRNCPQYGVSVGEIACYRTAGAMAAIFDKKGFHDYHCFIGVGGSIAEKNSMGDVSNHVWIEHNGNVYETFPHHNTKDLTYHKANVEIFFYT